ncbi:MAG TPA: zinc ribbon domain-containing protein [Armatimonadota bacterium]|nr:zinc ribbon domain-containing protein [Armatimonadota bacterium]
MPVYEYTCVKCEHVFDVRHGADEKPELACPQCRGQVRKVFHAAGIIFKGSGWHINDYAPKGARKSDEPAASTDAKTAETPAPAASAN